MRLLSTKMNAGVEVPCHDCENYVARKAPIIVAAQGANEFSFPVSPVRTHVIG